MKFLPTKSASSSLLMLPILQPPALASHASASKNILARPFRGGLNRAFPGSWNPIKRSNRRISSTLGFVSSSAKQSSRGSAGISKHSSILKNIHELQGQRKFLNRIISMASTTSQSDQQDDTTTKPNAKTDIENLAINFQNAQNIQEVFGGDHAGLSATFSPTNGELIPVPEHLVPQSMIDWGETPDCFEVLTSEDWFSHEEDCCVPAEKLESIECGKTHNFNECVEFSRTTVTVLPEVGCGIDNLETTKKVDRYFTKEGEWRLRRFSNDEKEDQRKVVTLDRVNPQYRSMDKDKVHRVDLDTIFQIDNEVETIEPELEGSKTESTTYPKRIRVSFSIDIPTTPKIPTSTSEPPLSDISGMVPKLSTPITLQIQRQTSRTSSHGTVWTGSSSNSGGLDARSVLKFIGRGIVNGDVFAVKKMKEWRKKNGENGENEDFGVERWSIHDGDNSDDPDGVKNSGDALCGKWVQTTSSGSDSTIVTRSMADFEPSSTEYESITTICLPQNILIRYGYGLNPPNSHDDEIGAADNNDKSTQTWEEWAVEISRFDTHAKPLKRRVVFRSLRDKGIDEGYLGNVSYWTEVKE